MRYLDALRLVHDILRPTNYLEIGCQAGASLSLSRCPSIGVDPDFAITKTLWAPTRLFRLTSDAFFSKTDPRRLLGDLIDLSFIDGMHLAEFALRDFMNLERLSRRRSVILIDDILPAEMAFATREMSTKYWTGDVYRVLGILREFRPDLQIHVYDLPVKGLAVISNLDPASGVLRQRFKEIEGNLAGEGWLMPSVEAIREACRPIPTERLADDLWALARERVERQPSPAAAPSGPAPPASA